MDAPFRSPDEHAADWRLATRVDGPGAAVCVCVPPLGELLLVADGEGGWWAVAAPCQACGAPLPASPDAAPGLRLPCTACGAAHGPHEAGCRCVPTLVVDDEIYVLASGRSLPE